MQLIVVTDIFGKTPELESLIQNIMNSIDKPIIIDPYDGEYIDFENESGAYDYFQINMGLAKYIDLVASNIKIINEPIFLLGFSIGASAIWAISNHNCFHRNTNAICFYGSQIRNLLDVNPSFDIKLIFPVNEDHFDVSDLILNLSTKQNVTSIKTPYLHGFMNEKSKRFDMLGFSIYTKFLKQYLINQG